MRIIAIHNGLYQDITAVTGNYQRSDNMQSLAQEFTFDFTDNVIDRYMKHLDLPIGSKIVVTNNDGQTIFAGIIISYSRNSLHQYSYKAYDYAYFLNKNEAIIQFNDVSISDALSQLCSQQNIPVGTITDIPTVISKIYNGQKISDIIDDLIKQANAETGKKYRREVQNGALCVEVESKLVIDAVYRPVDGMRQYNPCELVGSFSSEYSVEDMCNRVVIMSSQEKNQQILAEVSDQANINQYGQLTHYEKIDDKNSAQAGNVAQKKLKELNRVKRSFKVTMFGDDNVRSGRWLVFNQPDINLVGTFLVKNCTHKYNGNNHTMDVDLEVNAE